MEKVSFDLAVRLEAAKDDALLPVIVAFRDETAVPKALGHGLGERRFVFHPMVALRASPADVQAFARRSDVVQIWRDLPVHVCLDVSAPLIGAPRAWQSGWTGRGIRVAVVDTGIDGDHPALRGRVIVHRDMTGEGTGDGNGHGSHVAGIVASRGDVYRGIAPDAYLMSVKVLRSDGSGMSSDVMAGVEWAAQNGGQVINLSLGSGSSSDGNDPLSLICDAAVMRGIVVCVAAGNSGPARGTVGSPGVARRVITVGASTDADAVADFSSRGPTADDRVKPDIVFPGYGIISCRASGTAMGRLIDAAYTEASGTSMATPHAAGAVALLLQAQPGLDPEQCKQALLATARDLGLPPNTQGTGRAQVYEACLYQPSPTPSPVPRPGAPGCLAAAPRRLLSAMSRS